MMTKYELLASRSAIIGGVSDDKALFFTKELVMSLIGDGKYRNMVYGEYGAGSSYMLISKESIYQDETLGISLLGLIVFVLQDHFHPQAHHKSLNNTIVLIPMRVGPFYPTALGNILEILWRFWLDIPTKQAILGAVQV